MTYFETLSDIKGSSGGMTRACLANVMLDFADPDLKMTVTYQDENGTFLGSEQVAYGNAAGNAPAAPAKEGYVFAGWDHDLSSVRIDVTVKPVYHRLCTVRFLYPDGTQIGASQSVEETKPATPPDMTGETFDGKPFYKWLGDVSAIAEDTDFYGSFRFVPQWTADSYTRTDWVPADGNLLPEATMSAGSITYYTEAGRTAAGNAADLCNRAVPQAATSYTGVVGIKSGSVEWTFADKVYISALNVFTSWGGGGRDGIAISQVLYKTDAEGDWIEAAGPVDGNAISYGVGDNGTSGALYATLANSNDSFFISGATSLKVVFPSAQDNSGTGYVEIEAVGKTESQLAGGAVVTFLDWDGTVLQSGMVGFLEAAVPPEDPVRSGYKFIGWDADFSEITVALTVNALYHKWCSVEFRDADDSLIDSQTVEETLAATPPDMTGRTYGTDPFLCWDGDPSVILDDVVFHATYGVLPDYFDEVVATGTVPEDALIWIGGASGVWDATSRNWATPSGILTTWRDGAVAVLPAEASIALAGAQSASGIQIHGGDVVLSGDDLELAAPAKIVHVAGGTLRVESDVVGEAGMTVENIAASDFMPLGEANAVKLFEGLELSAVDTSSLVAVLHYSRGGAADRIVSVRPVADGANTSGINYFKSGDGRISFECRIILNDWYNNPYIAKVVLKQVGADIYGYVEKAEALENIANTSSVDVSGGTHRQISVETSALAASPSAATHRMAVEYVFFSDTDPMWNAATEFAGDYRATGEIAVNNGVLKVVGDGTMFGGNFTASGSSVTTPVILGDAGTFLFDSTAAQNFAMMLNARNSGSGYGTIKTCATAGSFVVGPNADSVTFTCSSEGMHRMYNAVHIYGTVTLAAGNYHMFYSNGYGGFGGDGGVLNLTTGYGDYGHRDFRLTCNAGGTVNYNSNQSMGAADLFAVFNGGLGNFTADYSTSNSDIKHKDIRLSNGAELTGVMMTWAHKDTNGKITVSGTAPSYVSLQKIRMGQNGKTANSGNKMWQTLDVADVTGDEEADLLVSSELYAHATASGTGENAKYFSIVKTGAGTVEFSGASTNYNAAITLQAGTVSFASTAKLNGTALNVEGDATLVVEAGAKIAFLDCAATAWTSGKTLSIGGPVTGRALRFGTDVNGLTADQLSAIVYNGKANNVFLDADGYLHTREFTTILFR